MKFMWQKRAPKEISFAVDYQSNAEQTTATAFSQSFAGKEAKEKFILLFVYYQREVISFSFNFMLYFLRNWQKTRAAQ